MGMKASINPVRSIIVSNGTILSKAQWMMDACPSGEYASLLAKAQRSLISKGMAVGPFLVRQEVAPEAVVAVVARLAA